MSRSSTVPEESKRETAGFVCSLIQEQFYLKKIQETGTDERKRRQDKAGHFLFLFQDKTNSIPQ